MLCPHCGADVLPGNAFCQRCGKRIGPPPAWDAAAPLPAAPPEALQARRPPVRAAAAAVEIRRPALVTLLAVLGIVGGAVTLLIGALMMVGAAGSKQGAAGIVAMGLVCGLIGAAQLMAGAGLWMLKPWGRTIQLIFSWIGLLGIPCGTIVSVLVLLYLYKPGVKLLFSGKAAQELTTEEAAQLAAATQSSSATTVLIVVIVLIPIVIAGIGIIAAIAIPSLLRARVSANESATIGDLRTMVSAQVAYAAANSGFYDTPHCLASPAECIPNYPASSPSFLDATWAAGDTRHGYRFSFQGGRAVPPELVSQGPFSPSSVSDYAYLAVPIQQSQTGTRSFCAEASGLICVFGVGAGARSEDGHCPADCTPLQ